jgi:putative ABC transport system ATP-binding protein
LILELKGVSKAYRLGERTVEVVRSVDLGIRQGEFTALMGPSGSGKSTLLHLLGLLDHPTQGRVFSDGRDLSALPDEDSSAFRNRMIGFVFQSFRLLPQYSALDNVALPLVYSGSADRKDSARELLVRMGLEDRMHHRPAELSGGEQQRVAICRALVNAPRILLADEPTGALDTRTGDGIMDIFLDLHRAGMTVVVVTHDPRIAKRAQRVLHFMDGKLEG